MPSVGWRIRAGVLLALGALGVHDLRYLLAYGGHAGHELSVQGHGYLRLLTPVIVGAVVLAAAAFVARLAGAYAAGSGEERGLPSTPRLWALVGSLLVSVYCLQEWIEGQLTDGHTGGLAAPFAHGGWLALPLALAIALLIALALRAGAAAIAAVARRRARVPLATPVALRSSVSRSVWAPPPRRALARTLAPRAPPASA